MRLGNTLSLAYNAEKFNDRREDCMKNVLNIALVLGATLVLQGCISLF